MLLTSYKDKKIKETLAMKSMGTGTADGMETCYEETRKYAEKDGTPSPDNIRSNSADRIKRYREGISWGNIIDNREKVMSSDMFKQSAMLFIQCVLSSVYCENVTLAPYKVGNLKTVKNPGREFFIDDIVVALYGKKDEDPPGMEMNRDEIVCIRHGQDLIGLLSSTGPIPAADKEKLVFLPEMKIDQTKDFTTIIRELEPQKKQILMHWLKKNEKNIKKCCLYNEIYTILLEENIKPVEGIEQTITIKALDSGVPCFPRLIDEYNNEKLNDTIALTPILDNDTLFGYDMNALKKDNNELKKAMWIQLDDYYVFIAPLTREAVELTKKVDFDVSAITYEQLEIENQKVVSVVMRCFMKFKNLELLARRKYTSEQIHYIKRFPSLSLYGPAPKFGWITRRDITFKEKDNRPFPLVSEAEGINPKDIEFDNLAFDKTEYDYTVYCGEIPEWLGVRANNVGWIGALPLRVVHEHLQKEWNDPPVFIHKEPPSGTITVAVDIGSSRTVILFKHDKLKKEEFDIMIPNNQILGISLTTPLDITIGEDAEFGNLFFQPGTQYRAIQGKTQVGILTSDKFESIKDKKELTLYKSGKLILIDPKSISAGRSNRIIISDIKSKAEKNPNAMYLLIQGILTMIVDRSLHLGCKEIKIRLAYLTETHNIMDTAWSAAVNKYKPLMPDCNITYDLYLPESLAITNRISAENGFRAGSGTALVDIGDYSTDIALFANDDKAELKIRYIDNISVLFAGKQILIEPIWYYLNFTEDAAVEDVFENVRKDNVEHYENLNTIISKLNAELKQQRIDKKINITEDVRSYLLCLMGILNKEKLSKELIGLDNLFDIGYLTEIIILKHLIKNIPVGAGKFNIHLFGGGSSFVKGNIKENSSDKDENVINWNRVLDRACIPQNISHDGNKLAFGLLDEPPEEFEKAIKLAKKNAINYGGEEKNRAMGEKYPLNDDDFKQGYIQFVKDALALKSWLFYRNSRKVDTCKVFNIKTNKDDENYSSCEIANNDLWQDNYDEAEDFARKRVGSSNNIEIIKTLFAYKMAYNCVVAFYKGERDHE